MLLLLGIILPVVMARARAGARARDEEGTCLLPSPLFDRDPTCSFPQL